MSWRLLGLPRHCGRDVVLDHWESDDHGREGTGGEWIYRCGFCGLKGLIERFDPLAEALDERLGLPSGELRLGAAAMWRHPELRRSA
ncbi:MAG: hypothetical protein ACRENL_05625 [Candidatus Dormibacteria bacterium]